MRVLLAPRITNYRGEPIAKEVGIVRPPTGFSDMVQILCTSKRITMQVEGYLGKSEIFFKGPYGIVRRLTDKKIQRILDFRTLHTFTAEKDKFSYLKMHEDLAPENSITFIFDNLKERDMIHLKLGTWMSYWETIKTNRVKTDKLRGFR